MEILKFPLEAEQQETPQRFRTTVAALIGMNGDIYRGIFRPRLNGHGPLPPAEDDIITLETPTKEELASLDGHGQ